MTKPIFISILVIVLHSALADANCWKKAAHQELSGPGATDLKETTYSGSNDSQKDRSCCQKCSENPDCEYWVRATDNSKKCWLKSNGGGKIEESESSIRRGGLRVGCFGDFKRYNELRGREEYRDLGWGYGGTAWNKDDPSESATKQRCQELCQQDPECVGVDVSTEVNCSLLALGGCEYKCYLNYENPDQKTISNEPWQYSRKRLTKGCNYYN